MPAEQYEEHISIMLDPAYSNGQIVEVVADKSVTYINRLIVEANYIGWILKTRTRLLEDEVRKRAEKLEKAQPKTKGCQTPDDTVNDR
jgi:hypothetical protein